MKNSTLKTIYHDLLDFGYESSDPIMEEISKELNRGAEEKAAKAAEYDTAWEIARQVLDGASTPLTALEIFEGADFPEGFSRNRVAYGLTHQWKDFVEKTTTGKVNTYSLIK